MGYDCRNAMSAETKRALLFCPKSTRGAVAFCAGLISKIDECTPWAPYSDSTKAGLAIRKNEENDFATLSFWYDRADPSTEKEVKACYDLDERFSISKNGRIQFETAEIQRFTPDWVDAYNAEQVIGSTFLGECAYAQVIDAFGEMRNGRLSCSFRFKIG